MKGGGGGFSLRRVALIAAGTFREAARQRLFVVVLLLGALFTTGAVLLRQFAFGVSELKFVLDLGAGSVTAFGTVLAIVAGAQLFGSELERRTAWPVLARPVLRSEFVLGKHCGVLAVLGVFVAAMTACLVAVLWWREGTLLALQPEEFPAGRIVRYGDVLLLALAQWVKLGLLAAFAVWFATYATSTAFAMGVTFVVTVIGHLNFLAREAWQRMEGAVPQALAALGGVVLPNLQLFALGDAVAQGQPLDPATWGLVMAYGAVYTAVVLGLAAWSFQHREI